MIINPYRFASTGFVFPQAAWIDYDPTSARYSGVSNLDSVLGLDSSGNSNDSEYGISDYTPKMDNGTLCNGNRTFWFANDSSGVNTIHKAYWTLPDLSSLTSGEAYIIYKLNFDPTVGLELGSGLWYFGTANSVNVHPYQDGNVYDDFGSTTRQSFSSGGNANYKDQWVLISAKANSSYQKIYYKNTLLNNFASNSFAFRSVPQIGYTAGNYFLSAHIARFIFFDSVLSDENSLLMRNHLIEKYDL